MKIEKRMFLFLIGLALIVSLIVYTTTKKSYENPPPATEPAASSTVNEPNNEGYPPSDTVDKDSEGR